MEADQDSAGGSPQLFETDPGCLEPPRYGFQPVERQVNARLRDWSSLPKVVPVVAPAGFGKTVLLAQLHSAYLAQGIDCVWVGLDERHSDCGRLITLLEQSLKIKANCSPKDALHTRVRRLADLLSRRSRPLVVLLDQLDAARGEEFAPVLDTLVGESSPYVRFLMASVRTLLFSQSLINVDLGPADVQEADLAFQSCEVAELLSSAGVSGAGADLVSLIIKRTEGWPAAVRLVQIMFAHDGPSPALLERFTGSNQDLAHLLWRRILNNLETGFVQLLMELAQLKSFSIALALFALENDKFLDLVGEVRRLNVPLVALDSANEWFRFHNLIREFLVAEAAVSVSQERRSRILMRAAEWFEAQGDDVAALDYALDASAFLMAARLLEKVAQVTVGSRGEFKTYFRWYGLVEASGVSIGFSAQYWYAYALQLSRQRGPAVQVRAELLKEGVSSPDAAFVAAQAEYLPIMMAVFFAERDHILEDGDRWLKSYRAIADPFQIATIEGAKAMVLISRQALSEARACLGGVQEVLAAGESAYLSAWLAAATAIVVFEEGEVQEADRLLSSGIERVCASLGSDAPILALLNLVRSAVLVEMGSCDEARAQLERWLDASGGAIVVDALRYGLESSLYLFPDEMISGASLQRIEQIAHGYPPGSVMLGALRVRRLALLGRVDDAIELANRLDITTFARPGSRTSADAVGVERSLLLLAELEIGVVHGDIETVRETIESELKRVNAAGLRRLAVDLYMLLFKLHMVAGHRTLALRSLSRALNVAGRRQILRPFLERGPLLRELLAKTRLKDFNLTQREDIAFLRRLRGALGLEEASAEAFTREDDETIDVEPLTPREMDLLRCLDGGMTNQQISDRLFLTLPTVKWHLYNLYSKLGVKSRGAALARARGLGLLGR